MEPIEGKILGKQVAYPQHYSPHILVAVPRALNREMYGLDEQALPFCGKDVWHAYELSFLTQKGLPVAGLLKFTYPAHSAFLVESKSLKLYLNGFNMSRYGQTAEEGLQEVLNRIRKDLEELLQTQVDLSFHQGSAQAGAFDFEHYELLEQLPESRQLNFDDFKENPALLTAADQQGVFQVATHLLRSNCKITHQPDWGSAYIHIKGACLPDKGGLLRYLVSIRNENHFHEEICEMIYKRLWDRFKPEELMVSCIYTRRGGIDICPLRASSPHLLPQHLANAAGLSQKLLQQ